MNRFLLSFILLLQVCFACCQQDITIDSIKVYRLPLSIVCTRISMNEADVRAATFEMYNKNLLTKKTITADSALISYSDLNLVKGHTMYFCKADESCIDVRVVIDVYTDDIRSTVVIDKRGYYEVLDEHAVYSRSVDLVNWLDKYVPEVQITKIVKN